MPPDRNSFDVFLSYRQQDPDRTWVRQTLVPALDAAGLRVCIDHPPFSGCQFAGPRQNGHRDGHHAAVDEERGKNREEGVARPFGIEWHLPRHDLSDIDRMRGSKSRWGR